MKLLFSTFFLLFANSIFTQNDTLPEGRLILSGYVDTYLQAVFQKAQPRNLSNFVYNYRRNNAFGINLALLKVNWQTGRVKLTLGLMSGDYALFNFAGENPVFQHVFEANFQVFFTKKISLEAGVLPSHTGMESAISKDHWNLSRSLVAEGSPYVETGVKVNFQANEMLTVSVLGLNGWQSIGGHLAKAFGSQVQFKPNEKLLLNFSTFYGGIFWEDELQPRLFLDFYVKYSPAKWLNLGLQTDIGSQAEADEERSWYGIALLGQINPKGKWSAGFRAERFADDHEVIVSSISDGVRVNGLAANLDWKPFPHFIWRLELRSYHADDILFRYADIKEKKQTSILSSVAVFF